MEVQNEDFMCETDLHQKNSWLEEMRMTSDLKLSDIRVSNISKNEKRKIVE